VIVCLLFEYAADIMYFYVYIYLILYPFLPHDTLIGIATLMLSLLFLKVTLNFRIDVFVGRSARAHTANL